jgi:hypothetical protein
MLLVTKPMTTLRKGGIPSTNGRWDVPTTAVDQNKRFADEFANPNSWLMMADNLHEQATEIYRSRSRSSITTRVNGKGEIVQRTRGIDKPVFLLCGFALENAIKAFLVYENPHWISNGRLSGRLKSHSLTGLQAQSKLIPRSGIRVLREFESGLDSWFRYPCGLTIEKTLEGRNLPEHLWNGYRKLMGAYGKKLTLLLGRGWNGPHGSQGQWMIRGPSLGYEMWLVSSSVEHPIPGRGLVV